MKVEILRRDCPSRSPHFNPLRPCGRRPDELWDRLFSTRFQSTPPVWAETAKETIFRLLSISITTYFTEKARELDVNSLIWDIYSNIPF